jgi:hypothetical protein
MIIINNEEKRGVFMKIIASVSIFLLVFAAALSYAETPIGYPWSTWGELTQTFDAREEEGLKLDAYLEQGVDWTKMAKPDLTLNTFLGIRGVVSDHASDYWNNKVGPWVGMRVKHPVGIRDGWGGLALGLRWEYYAYLTDSKPVPNDSRFVAFLQWGMGGDWKKK